MAGGKQTPRQKMINLMYLVFIAMLALQMGKEVLSAFGSINESLTSLKENFVVKNQEAFEGLKQKKDDDAKNFGELFGKAQVIQGATSDYYNYLTEIYSKLEASTKDATDYEKMDKGSYLDEMFMQSGKLRPEGQAFLDNMEKYRTSMEASLSPLVAKNQSYQRVIDAINEKFNTADVVDRSGKKVPYITYHYIGFPLIASLTKLTALRNDIKVFENEIYSTMLAGQLTTMVSMRNYTTLLKQERGAYYQGDSFDGAIVLGRTDDSTVPAEVQLTLNGRELVKDKDFEILQGQVKLNVTAGNVGDQKIEGKLIFMQDGEPVDVLVDQSFSVIPKPNQAIVSADKMNVVYRGVDNPLTVSLPGVPENKVKANAPGLRQVSGSKYVLKPTTGQEVKINVTGEIDGKPFPSSVTFRIKSLPRPTGTIRGQVPDGKPVAISKAALTRSPVGAEFENFDFDIKAVVKRFSLRVPGRPSITVNGDKFDAAATNLLNLANAGDIISIFDIRADVPGVNVPSPTSFEVQLTN